MDFEHPDSATPIDLDEAKDLIPTHVTTKGDLNRLEQDNIILALAWLEKTNPRDILNKKFIRRLHKEMFGDVWKWAGKFRHSDKNIGVTWQQIPTSLRNLLDDAGHWIEVGEESTDEMAVRFHHRLVSIHPFPNGNGRHARLMTDLLLENIFHQPRFTWGGQDLSKESKARKKYIASLHEADGSNYQPLLEFARLGSG